MVIQTPYPFVWVWDWHSGTKPLEVLALSFQGTVMNICMYIMPILFLKKI